MPTPRHTVTCLKKKTIAPNVYEIHLSKPDGFDFRPGQFVLWDIPLVSDPGDIQPRAYSIASTPSEATLIFVIKVFPEGRASRWIDEVLEEGMEISIQGPLGALKTAEGKPHLFIATGTGIAPFRSMMLSALESGTKEQIDLIFGVVKYEDFFWLDLWKELEEKYSNFTAHCSALSGEPDWHGATGSVQERVTGLIPDSSNASVYICGAPDLVKMVKVQCLEEIGMEKTDVHAEAYI